MPERSTRRRLDQPSAAGGRFRVDVDVEAFGRLAERLARFLGTGTYLFWQTLCVIVWVILNIVGILGRWDPYPFILLNLAFSTQAAYAAPLILLAQNRQDDRDRVSLDEDRSRASRTSAETEYLARELAAVRIALGEVVTRDFLRGELERGTGAERADRGGGVDRETTKAIGKAVDRSVDRAVSRAVDRIVEQAVETAVERALTRAGVEGPRANGRDRPGEPSPHT